MDPNAVIEVFRRNVTEHYFDLKGRVGRQEFWYFVLASFVVYVAAAIVDAVIRTGLLVPLVALALLLPMTGLGARRLQDVGRNGPLMWVWTISFGVMQLIGLLTELHGSAGRVGLSLLLLLHRFADRPGRARCNDRAGLLLDPAGSHPRRTSTGRIPDAGTAAPAKP